MTFYSKTFTNCIEINIFALGEEHIQYNDILYEYTFITRSFWGYQNKIALINFNIFYITYVQFVVSQRYRMQFHTSTLKILIFYIYLLKIMILNYNQNRNIII